MVSDVSFPRVNGVSTSIRTFRQSLARLGHDSTLIAPEYPGADDPEPEVLRIRARSVPLDPEDRYMSRRAILALEPALAARGYDLVHVHTPFVAHYAGVALARRLGVPVVETYHTFFEEYLHHYLPFLPSALTRLAAREFSRSQCAAVDALIVPSAPMLATLRGYGVRVRAEVLPTGIELEEFADGDGAGFRRRHGIADSRPVLVHISRVAHEKNLDFVLAAVALARREVPELLLVVAGEGPALAHLRRLAVRLGIEQQVLFVGYLDRRRELLDCYRAGDAFVFASRTETQGLVLLEAMAQGCAVVSTAHLGTASILQAGCGARVAPDEPVAFAQAVIDLLNDPERAARCGTQARAYAHGWASSLMAGRMRDFYADQLARAKIHPEPAVPAVPGESHERKACLDSR